MKAASVFLAFLLLGPGALAQERPTYKVESSQLVVRRELAGVFAARDMTALAVAPEKWNELVVAEVAAHGQEVAKGETVLRLESDDLSRKIDDLELDRDLGAVGLQQARIELEMIERTLELDLPDAERELQVAKEDLEAFEKTNRKIAERGEEESRRGAEHALQYAEEELAQLRRMYEADDLTEETEEIVLVRQQRAVEAAQFRVERARAATDEALALSIPRRHQEMSERIHRAELALARIKEQRPLEIQKKQVEIQRQEMKQAATLEELAMLRRDLEAMTVTAPHDGLVYYGSCTNGKWGDAAAIAGKNLRPGGKLTAREVILTVVKPAPLVIRAIADEAVWGQLAAGQHGSATPAAYPASALAAEIAELARVPQAEGKLECVLAIKATDGAPALAPGLTCKVAVVVYENPEALMVPAAFISDMSGEEGHVNVQAGAEVEAREVRLGRKEGDKVEVLSGLVVGDLLVQVL